MSNMMTVTYMTDEGEDVEEELPCRKEVCPRCDGHGTHLTPSIGEHAYTQEEFEREYDDEESRAAYFQRGGMYDVQCCRCHGDNVVEVVDEARCTTEEQKRILKAWKKAERDRERDEREERHERMMGY